MINTKAFFLIKKDAGAKHEVACAPALKFIRCP